MNYVFYDFETSGRNKDFDQILQIGAVLTDSSFQIKDKINISCRLKKDTVPAPEALLINKVSIEQLKSNEVSLVLGGGAPSPKGEALCCLYLW